MKYGYIIGLFRADTVWEMEQNARNAERLGFEVAELGAFPIILHANTRFFNGASLEGTRGLMLRAADFAITVEALGFSWRHSRGNVAEVECMETAGRPVFHSLPALRAWLTNAP
jgi:hypothetical protein